VGIDVCRFCPSIPLMHFPDGSVRSKESLVLSGERNAGAETANIYAHPSRIGFW
jgi:hypothetical protein